MREGHVTLKRKDVNELNEKINMEEMEPNLA